MGRRGKRLLALLFLCNALQLLIGEVSEWANNAQLPGRLFSPSHKSKKLSHHFLLHFPIGVGSYDHHAKYQGVFMDLK